MKRAAFKDKIISVLMTVCVVIVALVIWQIIVIVKKIPAWQMPLPSEIIKAMVISFGELAPKIFYTYTNILLGFLMAILLGLVLGALISSNKMAGIILTPYINLLCMIPLITIVPLLMLWMGFGREVKLITIVIQSFPIMNLNCCVAFSNVDTVRLELMDSLKAGRVQKFLYCILPGSVPGVFTGVKLASILSIIACVSAEMSGGSDGLGASINYYVSYMKMPQAFACIFYIMIGGIVLYSVVGAVEAKLMKNQ